MKFTQAIKLLEQGYALQRRPWLVQDQFVVKQIPCSVKENIIPGMQSLPQSAKDILMAREFPHIDYTCQMLVIQSDGRADSWIPLAADIFADDWQVYQASMYENERLELKVESDELGDKLVKLNKFINSEEFKQIDEDSQYLLKSQLKMMLQYNDTLHCRLALWVCK